MWALKPMKLIDYPPYKHSNITFSKILISLTTLRLFSLKIRNECKYKSFT